MRSGNSEWGVGMGEWEMGNGKWEMENEEWENVMGNLFFIYFF